MPPVLVAGLIVVVVLALFLVVARRPAGDAERRSSWTRWGGDGGAGL